ncbi:hypothetical protein FACS1894155_10540 [Bacteroidia bacterium]|nr:hypothetical protein FACS1894155_10540 [Bacteroidia bacterium]
MKATEVNKEIIGKRCKCVFTGLMVTGTIEDIKISEYTAEVKVRYDKPHQWGSQSYEDGWAFARLHDDFGSLRHLEIIDDKYQTIKIRFEKSIAEIDRKFAQEYSTWGAVNLKEWIDNYESSRFTQIANDTAIITSEYNMESLMEWFEKHISMKEIEHIN